MKKCKVCQVDKEEDLFYTNAGRTCKECANKRSMELYELNKEYISIRSKVYRKKNSKKIKKKAAAYRKIYNHSAYSAAKMKEYRSKITDSYVKSILRSRGIKNTDITAEMIEEVSLKILLQRIKREIEKNGSKICSKCLLRKSIDEFAIKKFIWKGVVKEGRDNYCKKCSAERNKNYIK